MKRLGWGVSRAVGVALGALIFDVVRRRLRADTWDYGFPEAASGDRDGRTVVTVTFSRDDFRTVSRGAEAAGMPAPRYICDAALARAGEERPSP